jgi:hypothetical protein
VAAGFVPEHAGENSDSEPELYRVDSILDLGVTLRLFMMAGRADFVVIQPNSDEPAVLRWNLSTDSHVAIRMLIS